MYKKLHWTEMLRGDLIKTHGVVAATISCPVRVEYMTEIGKS
jgi:hypothetical protein